MNYNQINRNSLMSCIYSDRPNGSYPPSTENWKPADQHLNPSKSKVNVRQSLNKTVESCPVPTPTLTNVRNSCLFTSATSAHPPRQDHFLEDKYFKAAKENQEPSINPREHFPRYSQVIPPTQERRKSQSAHFRANSSNDFLFKLQDFRPFDLDRDKLEKTDRIEKSEKTLQQGGDQLKEMILALTKRVASNEEEIAKLKEKEKRTNTVEEYGEMKNKMFELSKFNSKNFVEFQNRLKEHTQAIGELRDRVLGGEEWGKRVGFVEHRLNDLAQGARMREENADKQINGQLVGLQSGLKKFINQEVNILRNTLELSKKDNGDLANRIKRLENDLTEKIGNACDDYKKSNKKSLTSLIVQSKEILLIREGELMRDRTRQLLNPPQSSKRDYIDEPKNEYMDTPRREVSVQQPRRQLIIRQKLYFIDTNGYLLDQNKYYLLNHKNQQIMLPEHLITALRDNQMLSTPTPVSTPRR